MGYDLHIFRKTDWTNDDEDSNITLKEWLQYVESDNELKLSNELLHGAQGFCIWLEHPLAKGDSAPWFDYSNGTINTKNPDNEVIDKMLAIADKLNAKVQGDDGELYDEEYIRTTAHFTRNTSAEFNFRVSKKPWWKFW